MPARLILFTPPILLTAEKIPSLFEPLKKQEIPENLPYTEKAFSPGTYELPIPSSANYTLTVEADGSGVLQRTMAELGADYRTIGQRGEKEQTFLATGETQMVETYPFEPETRETLLTFVIGSPEGLQLHGVFLHTPEVSS